MDRWVGILRASLNSKTVGSPAIDDLHFNVAASLCLSPFTKTLTVPTANVVFFYGDRVKGTGNRVIEEVSDGRNVADFLVKKFGRTVNAWVVEASRFEGPFAVYKKLVPSVDPWGNPSGYDHDGFPASSSIVKLLSACAEQVKDIISKEQAQVEQPKEYGSGHLTLSTPSASPKSIVLGFSKGGIVLNQILTELAHLKSQPCKAVDNECLGDNECVVPTSKDSFLRSICQFHYIDVGLNCPGAYITDHDVIKKLADSLSSEFPPLRLVLHGTPRQWSDTNRRWIGDEKDRFLQILNVEAHRSNGKLEVTERFYFANMVPSLQMHFEIIKDFDVN